MATRPSVSAEPKLPADQMSTITASTSVIPRPRQRIHERRVGLDHRLGLDRLVGMDRRMHAVHLASHLDLAVGQGDDHLGGRAGGRIEHDRERPPRK